MKLLDRVFNWVSGYYWKPIRGDDGSWGIYHPTISHAWRYGMTKEAAKAECKRRNSL